MQVTAGGNRRLALAHLAQESGLYVRHLTFARTDLEGWEDMALLLRAIEEAAVAVHAVESIATAKMREGS